MYLMDEKGGRNPEDNSSMLFDEYWDRLRKNLLSLLEGSGKSGIAINITRDSPNVIPSHPIIIMPEKWIKN